MSPQIEFNAAETPTTVPLAPAGVPVDLKIELCELGESGPNSKNPGTPQYKVCLRVVAPGELYDGDSLFMYYSDVPRDRKQLIRFNQLATAAGLDTKSGKWETEQLIGKAIKAVLSVKPAGGGFDEGRNVKSFINPS
jgi:hypothetical protein